MSIQTLKLCSDLNSFNYRVTYRHIDCATDQPIGPSFPNKERAREWYLSWLASQHTGAERRETVVDRRRHDKRTQFELRSEGRRRSDQPIEFEDRVGWMLNDLAKLRRGKADA